MIPWETIQSTASRIAEKFQPDKIILFGSYAYGVPTDDSDIDLLVVMNFQGRPIQKAIEISKALGYQFDIDIKVYSPEEIQWRYEGYDPLIRYAINQGKVLYEGNRHGVAH